MSPRWRRRTATLLGALSLLGLAACPDTTRLTIEVVVPERYGDRLSELEFIAAIYTPGEESQIQTCDALAFGAHDLDELSSALSVRANIDDTDKFAAIERVQDKLVVIEGLLTRGEGEDAREVTALFGCTEVGEVLDEQQVQVQTHPTVALRLREPNLRLTAAVPFGGEGAIAGDEGLDIVVEGRDAWDEAVSGTRVQVGVRTSSRADVQSIWTTQGESGRVLDDAGTTGLTIGVRGPFDVTFVAEYGLDEAVAPVPGFAAPASIEIAPFGQRSVRWMVPVRMGPRAVGFAAHKEGLGQQPLLIAVASGDEDPDTGLPKFDLLDEDTLGVTAAGMSYVGQLRPLGDNDAPLDQWVAIRDLAGNLAMVSTEGLEVGIPASTEIDLADGPVAFSTLDIVSALPVGLCEADIDAAPLLVTLTDRVGGEVVASRDAPLPGFLMQVRDAGPVISGSFELKSTPLLSTCVRDTDLAWRRLLITFSLDGGFRITDLGPGLSATASPEAFTTEEPDGLFGAVRVGRVNEPGLERLLVSTAFGFEVRVEELPILPLPTPEGESFLGTRRFLHLLPPSPRVLGGGPLFRFGEVDYYHLLQAGAGDEDSTPGVLYLTLNSGEGNGPNAGGATLELCAPASSCTLTTGDFNDDDVLELYVARTRARGDALPAAEVWRFDQPD